MADWLCSNIENNDQGIAVWNHHFDWEYRDVLRAPWYSALAQGQGISLLVRAERIEPGKGYLETAGKAFEALLTDVGDGGVRFVDAHGDVWLEEYVMTPPTHILNGFMWTMWGVHDLHLATGDAEAKDLFAACIRTLVTNLHRYDAGFWSLYEISGTRLKMMASPFYHSLHIVQLEIMHALTGEPVFLDHARRWKRFKESRVRRTTALGLKAVFKVLYY